MFGKILNFFGGDPVSNFSSLVKQINDLEPKFEALDDKGLREFSDSLRTRFKNGAVLDDLLPEAFALTREAAKRTLKQRHFDVQLIGGMVLHQGKIAEMLTGEGKTLVATLPAYLNALAGQGVHVVTVNDYLARRDAVWMGQIYHLLGFSVSCLTHDSAYIYDPAHIGENSKNSHFARSLAGRQNENFSPREIPRGGTKIEIEEKDKERDMTGSFRIVEDFFRPVSRREAYLADITYGTNHEFGFDYLRDNLSYRLTDQVQSGRLNYAIIDEVDSILIDEARTPLIIAAPDQQSSQYYKTFARLVEHLEPETDYTVEEKRRSVHPTEAGIAKTEKMLGINNLFDTDNLRLVHFFQESLKAKALFRRDRDYVVKSGEIIIVDEFTGRLLPGRRYSGGLHQAIEAKESVFVQNENRTFAQITIQNYFRLYKKIAGMTGTAQTSAEEFHKVYNLDAASVPSNKPLIRNDESDAVYKNADAKYRAVAEEVRKRREAGQPVLLGTPSIEKNEILSGYLKEAGIPHEILNAKNHEREGAIIAQAGRRGAVTVATNMAGRGVDIVLGGNPPDLLEAQKIKDLGGLLVVGTERHEARRIDNQLRGRSGRQGDPGRTRFFLALDDDLLRIFGGERLQKLMSAFNLPEDLPIESGAVTKAINQAQTKIEGINFDLRKHLLDYDDVLNRQRSAVYAERQKIMVAIDQGALESIIKEKIAGFAENFINGATVSPAAREWPFEEIKAVLKGVKLIKGDLEFEAMKNIIISQHHQAAQDELRHFIDKAIEEKFASPLNKAAQEVLGARALRSFDMLWMEHLENLEALQESVRIRAYGQHDPLVEYRREAHKLYKQMMDNFENMVFTAALQFLGEPAEQLRAEQMVLSNPANQPAAINVSGKFGLPGGASAKLGRNDPCLCGSGKKYKKCHGS